MIKPHGSDTLNPLFVADDVDGSGQIEVGERLVRLSTSKIRALYMPHLERAYWRGVDLHQAPQPDSPSHATMTVGMIATNNLPYSRYVGVAPDVEVALSGVLVVTGAGG